MLNLAKKNKEPILIGLREGDFQSLAKIMKHANPIYEVKGNH